MKKIKYFSVFFMTIAVLFSLGCASTSTQEGTGEYIDDSVITVKVKSALFHEPALKSTDINVETFKGEVQLSGYVDSQSDINLAIAVTGNIKGVKSIKNDMRIK